MLKNDKCERLEELLKDEIPALIEAVNHRRNLLEKEKHMKVPYHMAEIDFMNRYLNSWAEGFRYMYCSKICPDQDNCEAGYKHLHQYTDYYNDEQRKDIS